MSTEYRDPLPFHKSIVEAIKEADDIDMACLANLIVYQRTAIPADHDRIKAVWVARVKKLGMVPVIYNVPAYLDAEKERCEAKAATAAAASEQVAGDHA